MGAVGKANLKKWGTHTGKFHYALNFLVSVGAVNFLSTLVEVSTNEHKSPA